MKVKKICVSILISLIMLTIGTNVVKATTNENFHNFTGMYIETESIKKGEKVYVDFYGNTNDIIEVRAEVALDDTVTVVKIEDLDTSNPYFVMPEWSKTGFYEMVRVIVECEHGLNSYSTKLGEKNYTNCFEKKYFELEKARVDVELTNLSLASHYTTIKNGDKLWLNVEFKGSVYAEFVTMVVKNKENPDMKVLVSLKETNHLQYIDVFGAGTQTQLEDGMYYISDLYINPDKENYVVYSLDKTGDDVRPLEYNVEFEIKNNTLELTNLSLASHYTTIKNGDRLWLDVEIKGQGVLDLVTMSVRNKENPNMCAVVSLKQDDFLQYIDVFDIGTQKQLEDGAYYISDLYINPNKEDYIHYSLNLDESDENANLLEYYVEFVIDTEDIKDEDVTDNDNNIIEDENTNDENIENEENNDNNNENNNESDNENSKEDLVDNKEENKESENDEKVDSDIEDEIEEEIEEKIETEEDSLKVKIYEILLKILELLSIM